MGIPLIKMKLIALIALFPLVKASIDLNKCGGVTINGINYEVQVIKDNLDRPYQLAIDYDTSTLFFSYTGATGETDYVSAYINLKNDEFGLISGVKGGFASTVDSKTHIAYIGGEDGIYEYDFNLKTAKNVQVTQEYVWNMFYKNGVYYTTHPSAIAYLYKDGIVNTVSELNGTKVESIAIDNYENIFFTNSTGIFCYKKISNTIEKVGDYSVLQFTSDVYGRLYFVTLNGIFAINEQTKAVEQLSDAYYTLGVAMEGDGHIIYAADDSVVRLKSTGKGCTL